MGMSDEPTKIQRTKFKWVTVTMLLWVGVLIPLHILNALTPIAVAIFWIVYLLIFVVGLLYACYSWHVTVCRRTIYGEVRWHHSSVNWFVHDNLVRLNQNAKKESKTTPMITATDIQWGLLYFIIALGTVLIGMVIVGLISMIRDPDNEGYYFD